jgi:drug/metabolite transporter (DMT)-like permease
MGELLAFVCALTFSLSGLLLRYGQRSRPRDNGLFMTSLVNLVIYTGLTLGALVLGVLPPITLAGVLLFVLAGVTNTLVGRWSWLQSLRLIGPSRSTSLKSANPVFAALLALIFLGQPLGVNTVIGMAFVLGGVLLLQRSPTSPPRSGDPPSSMAEGVGLGLFSAFSYGCGAVLRAAGLGTLPSPFVGALLGAMVASVSIFASDVARGNLRQRWADNVGRVPRSFLLAGVLAAAAQLSQFASLQYTTVARSTVIASTEPLITTLLSAAFFSQLDTVTRRSAVSVVGIVLGVAVVAFR